MKTPSFWKKKTLLSTLLTPFTWFYARGLKSSQKKRLKKAYQADVSVISVGNITSGGSGKTPIVAALAKHFSGLGEDVAIVSRGYGRLRKDTFQVGPTDTAETVGDEPLMLFESGVCRQVWVGPNRARCAEFAVKAGASLIIMDDGFQHNQLKRDIDIVVIDGTFGMGNQRLIPAGPMREPLQNIERADFAVVLKDEEINVPGLPCKTLTISRKVNEKEILPLLERDIFVFCGIGLPEKFIKSLEKEELRIVGTEIYKDHHMYSESDIQYLFQRSQKLQAQLVTTPKDAVKLPEAFRKRCHILSPSFDATEINHFLEEVRYKLRNQQNGKKHAKS